MAGPRLTKSEHEKVERSVAQFVDNLEMFESFASGLFIDLQSNKRLAPLIHFAKYRIKDPEHLRAKLTRKILEGKGTRTPFSVDENDVFEKVNDMAGIRIIHLNTEQLREIHSALLEVFDEQLLESVEPPTANCWDIEFEKLFTDLGIATRSRESMYTTVHYVIAANRRTKIRCEIQVRTLMDEVWAEVSHRVNYPDTTPSVTCRDQLKVLARFTTGCTRLVDSIFRSHKETGR